MLSETQVNKLIELFTRFGVKSYTMDDISQEFGISKKTLYQWVPSKEALLRYVLKIFMDREKKCMLQFHQESKHAIDEMILVAQHVNAIIRKFPPNVIFELKKYHQEVFQQIEEFNSKYVYDFLLENLKKGKVEGLYRKDFSEEIIAKLYVGKTSIITDEQFFSLNEYDRRDLFNTFIMYHLRGIASEKGNHILDQYLNTLSNETQLQ